MSQPEDGLPGRDEGETRIDLDDRTTSLFKGPAAATPSADSPSPALSVQAEGNSTDGPIVGAPRFDTDSEFFIPVQGFVRLTQAEVAVINHPALQRLGYVRQLGHAPLLFRGATHTRMEHVIGTLAMAEEMVAHTNANIQRIGRASAESRTVGSRLGRPVDNTERAFIRLAALLHDIGHIPSGHTLEDELNLLPRHDERARLDLILDRADWPGADSAETLRDVVDREYASWLRGFAVSPSELVKGIIAKDPDALSSAPIRVAVCRDIVGNTICADLLDYLHRDLHHLGKPKYFERRLLDYLEIRETTDGTPSFVVSLGTRPRIRTDAVSAILDLLEARYGLAEVVVFHRTKLAAAAMLERGIAELAGEVSLQGSKPNAGLLAELTREALDTDDLGLLDKLLGRAGSPRNAAALLPLGALRNRRLYTAFYTKFRADLATDEFNRLFDLYGETPKETAGAAATGAASKDEERADERRRRILAAINRLNAMRLLETDFGLPPGSIAMYWPGDRDMNAKIAKVKIHVNGVISPFDEYEANYGKELSGGHLDAQVHRFRRLWRVHIVVAPKVLKKLDSQARSALEQAIDHLVLWRGLDTEKAVVRAREIVAVMSTIPGSGFEGKHLLPEVDAARQVAERALRYPSGAPSLKSLVR